MKQPRAIIIVPTYNERENIAKLVPALSEVFTRVKHWDMHVLVVDDSSPDGTADEVRKLKKKYPNLHLLVNPKKLGLGRAYLAGMREAFTKLDAEVVFEFDADFSHDPNKIPQFLEKLNQGADIVIGSRYIKGGSIPDDWGLNRKFLSVFGNLFIVLVLTDFRVHDWTGGYRAIRREVYQAVHKDMEAPRFSGYTFQIAFLRKSLQKGFKVAEVPFKFVDRKIGKSKLGSDYFRTALEYIITTRLDEIRHHRVFKFAVVGFLGFFINTLGLFLFSRIQAIADLAAFLRGLTGLAVINTSGTASALGAECAIVSNFIFNNLWTFSDRKITSPLMIIPKFIQFNLSSFGAVAVQFLVVGTGTHFTGEGSLSRFFWLVVATAIGMVINYIVYSKFIWRKKS